MSRKANSEYMDPKRAFSGDGYIIDQRYTASFGYGRFRSDYNGCAWIAAYNFLKSVGIKPDNADIRGYMGSRLRFGGFIGTKTALLCEYLGEKGVPVNAYKGRSGVLDNVSRCRSGIIRYCDPIYPHFVAFTRSGDGYRFFNASPGDESHVLTMEDFLKKHCRLPFIKLITNV